MAEGIVKRRSIRKFKPLPVPRELLIKIAEAGRLAPSAKNRQPWKYIVYTGDAKAALLRAMEQGLIREKFGEALLPASAKFLADAFNTLRIMREAPVLFVIMNTNGQSPYEPIDTNARLTELSDTLSIGASVENMLVTATELGLGSLWIANTCFAYTELMEVIGEAGQLVGAVAFGFADEAPRPRPRKDLSAILEFRE